MKEAGEWMKPEVIPKYGYIDLFVGSAKLWDTKMRLTEGSRTS